MNRIYRIIFNRTLGVSQVVSELAGAAGGVVIDGAVARSRSGQRLRLLAAAVGLALVCVPTLAQARVVQLACTASATSICGTEGGDGRAGARGAGSPLSGYSAGGAGSVSSGTYANGGGNGGEFNGLGYGGQGVNRSGGAGGRPGYGGYGGSGGVTGTRGYGGGGGGGGGSPPFSYYFGGGGGGGGGVAQQVNGSAFANPGTIVGGNGGNGGNGGFFRAASYGGGGGGGGSGIFAAAGSISSAAGTIISGGNGGNGGYSYHAASGGGGGSAVVGSGFSLTAAGSILGGVGGNGGGQGGYGSGGNGASGGAGISGASLTIATTGRVSGGAGGNGGIGSYRAGGNGGVGGAGVVMTSSSLTNTGTIAGANGGSGGQAISGNGGLGFSSGINDAYLVGGNGGVGGAGVLMTSSSLTNTGTIAGANGGLGGTGGVFGGNGGSGGAGLSGTGLTITNAGTISGGAGGNGGNGRFRGNGGVGGAGAVLASSSLTNTGTIAGANGGLAGTGGAAASSGAGGGVGVIASGGTQLINAGTLQGGLAGGGTARANAVSFSGGANVLTLEAGSSIIGNVISTSGTTHGGDTFNLGGNINAIFSGSLGALGSGAQYQGFNAFEKTGSSTWTLTVAVATSTPFIISAGMLQVGNGGTTGALVGNVADSGTLVFAHSDAVSFAGVVSGSGSLTQAGTGSLILTGGNTYTGGTTIAAGALQVGNGGTAGAITGNVVDSGTLAFAHSDAVSFAGVVSGSGSLTQAGAGSLILTGTHTYTGGTTINAGTLQLGNGGTTGSIVGNVIDNGVFALDHSNASTFSGVVSGSGSLLKAGTGGLTLTGANSYTGGTALDAGTLVLGNASAIGTGALAMAQGTTLDFTSGFLLANAIRLSGDPTVNVNTGLTTTLSGGISDGTQPGYLVKTGGGMLVLTGVDTYTGLTEAAAGTLDVQGSLISKVAVDAGATLIGGGSTGDLSLASGGTVAPGVGGVGTLTVNGNLSFAAGSSYQVDALDTGSSDLIHATGTATLHGGSVLALAAGTQWAAATRYTIVTADGGLGGGFGGATSNFAFLTPTLSYDANHAYLTLTRNATTFASLGTTPNQRQTATAIVTGSPSAVYGAILPLAAGPARAAFNELGGDSLASHRTAIVEDSRYVRDAINNHLQGVQGAGQAVNHSDAGSAWASAWGHGGSQAANGNAASLASNGSGLLVGADRDLGDWRLGAVVGAGQLSSNNGAGADAHSSDTVAGLYSGMNLGAWQWQGGVAHSWYQTSTHRQIDVSGLAGRASARLSSGLTQAYVDGGYRVGLAQGSVTPFVNLARVWLRQGAIHEMGSAAALDVQAGSSRVNYGTVGLRGVYEPSAGLQLHASAGYQHAWGDLAAINRQQFGGAGAAGAASFTVAGLPVAQNAGIVDLGMRFAISTRASVDVSYHGQFAGGATDQGVRMALSVAL